MHSKQEEWESEFIGYAAWCVHHWPGDLRECSLFSVLVQRSFWVFQGQHPLCMMAKTANELHGARNLPNQLL